MIVNGRFLHSEPGGFRNYGVEVSRRLRDATLVSPPKYLARGVRGKFWEQTVLAARARQDVLWSPIGSGPIRHRRHVVTIHDVAPFVDSGAVGGSFGLAQRRLLPSLARSAAMLLVDSSLMGRDLANRFGIRPERLMVAPPGVSDSFREVASLSRAEARSSLGLTRLIRDVDGPLIGGLVSSIPRKNSGAVLDALATLVAEEGVRAVVAGWDGPRRVFGSGRRPQNELVDDLGSLTDVELALFYRSLDVFVWLPSYEGFGLPIVECAAAGTPVVCTAMPAAIEHLDGDVAAVNNSLEAQVAVRDLLSDSVRRDEMSRRARAAVAGLTWDRTAQSVLNATRIVEEATT